MGRKNIEELKFRRRREAKTNYSKRLALIKGNLDRVVVRKTNKRIIAQIVSYNEKGDMVKAFASSAELKGFGWEPKSNKASAYLTGMLLASKISKQEKEKEHILDIGLSSPVANSIPFVFAKGCIDNGLKLRGTFEIDKKTFDGTLTSEFATKLKQEDAKAYERQFGGYIKDKFSPEAMPKLFEEAKAKIMAKK